MFTGLHPLRTGVEANYATLRPEFETLAERLHEAGYATLGASAAFHLAGPYGFGQGFDEYAGTTAKQDRRTADQVNADLLRMIASQAGAQEKRPLFLFAHYFDVHAPYVAGGNPGGNPTDNSPASIERAYDSGIQFVDRHVRDLIGALDEAGFSEKLLVVITSDHGEQLGEHGLRGGHADIYTETIRVPLIVSGAGIDAARIGQTVSSMSVAPSILGLAGLEFGESKDAPSLVPLMRGEEGTERPESLLVVGYPSYTRSVGLRTENLYFIRNLESIYREIAVGPAPEERMESRVAKRQADVMNEGNARVFLIPSIAAKPQRVTADIQLKAHCATEVKISLPFSLNLLTYRPQGRHSRVEYAVARLDPTFVGVTPASCAEQVAWEAAPISPFGTASVVQKQPGSHNYQTGLFSGLLTWRTGRNGDELYDLSEDPAMSNNIIQHAPAQEVERLRDLVRTLLHEESLAPAVPESMSSDEMERLRRLGYIQ